MAEMILVESLARALQCARELWMVSVSRSRDGKCHLASGDDVGCMMAIYQLGQEGYRLKPAQTQSECAENF
eukprot:scaffold4431_cov69-Skeletonema_dohrnii-CCMP3373.AAC.1